MKFITKNSSAQTKHTLEHQTTQDLWSLLIASELGEKTHYGTNVCGKGWLLTLAAGDDEKKSEAREKSLHLLCLGTLCLRKSPQVLVRNREVPAKTYQRTT